MSQLTLTLINILLTFVLMVSLSVVGWLSLQVVSLKTQMATLSESVEHLAEAVKELKSKA